MLEQSWGNIFFHRGERMSIRTQIRGGLMVVTVLILSTSSAWGQMAVPYPVTRNSQRNMMNPNARPPVEQRTPFEGSGVVEGAGPLGLAVNANGMSWKVKPDKNCKIEVTGTADPDFLKPGLWVKFTGDINKGKVSAPVNELEIVDQRTAMVNEKEKSRSAQTSTDAGAKKGKGAATGTAANSGPILGKITAYKSNELTLETGSGTVKADLGPNPSIKVNVSDFSWAQPGDTVDVKGWYMQPGAAMAQDIKVTIKDPLGDNSKKKAKADKKSAK
jgi:hypothetical protein